METKNRLVGAKDREEGEARVAVGLLESLNFGKWESSGEWCHTPCDYFTRKTI